MPDIYCKKCICSQEPIISTEYRTFYFPIASAEFIIQNFLLFSHYLDHQAQAYLERYTHIVLWSLGSDQYGMFLNTILMLLLQKRTGVSKTDRPPLNPSVVMLLAQLSPISCLDSRDCKDDRVFPSNYNCVLDCCSMYTVNWCYKTKSLPSSSGQAIDMPYHQDRPYNHQH
jgi:hypothetical protein